ncbi:glycoside hydrolase family 65 protein [Enterococcus sp. LJL120]
MKKLIKQGFELTNDNLLLQETLFHTANGYLGVRGNFEEGYPQGFSSSRGQYINGFYDVAEMKQAEQLYGFVNKKEVMLNVADTQSFTIEIGGEAVSLFENATDIYRELDMEKGTALRQFTWHNQAGQSFQIAFKRMASFVVLPLFTIELTITSNEFSGEIKITSKHNGEVTNFADPNDPRVAAESEHYLRVVGNQVDEAQGISKITAKTQVSDLAAETIVFHESKLPLTELVATEVENTFIYQGEIAPKQPLNFTKFSLFLDSRRYDLANASEELIAEVKAVGLSDLYQKQAAYLAEFWQNAVAEVSGDQLLNESLDYSLYSLLQSAGKDGISNIAAKGLSGEGYEGHYFWDTEIYMMPFFTLTNPQITQKLIHYRYSILDKARENARILGHQTGALYPWRTIAGAESSGYFPSGTAQYHINSDIAYAIIQYYLATGDLQLIADYGAEVIFETARVWLEVGHFTKEHFVINAVTGPDEYTCVVNNNFYTNISAKYHLEWAGKFYQVLTEAGLAEVVEKIGLTSAEIAEWQQAAAAMYLPFSKELQIHEQDDSFLAKPVMEFKNLPAEKFPLLLHYHPLYLYRHQVTKQADLVLAYFLYENQFEETAVKRGYDYYEPLTTHDSSLSSCIFSIVANQFGDSEKAYNYFDESSKIDITNSHKNTKDGIHAANMGGTYLGLVFGFGGLRLTERGISLRPHLPKNWDKMTFSFHYQGSQFLAEITETTINLTLVAGAAQSVMINGENYLVEEKTVIKRGA